MGKSSIRPTAAERAVRTESVQKLLETLRSGPSGVRQVSQDGLPEWLQRDVVHLGLMYWFPQWAPLDLANANLTGLQFERVHSSRANFAGANLSEASLSFGSMPRARFEGAKLRGSRLIELKLQGACLRNADCSRADLHYASLREADCSNTSFVNTDLRKANLCQANLQGADLSGARLEETRYDEGTRWPHGFEPTANMRWMGAGASPFARKQARRRTPRKVLDSKSFVERLGKHVSRDKVARALNMLRAERFQLFSEVQADRLVGVIKSQVQDDLVYSCKIDSNGSYGCCMPDLKPCWGLRGSPCKHVLLLMIGLVQNGSLDPNIADSWVLLACSLKPVLDKQTLADTLVRYKAAQAGEVDWRPTETIPEDFYAM